MNNIISFSKKTLIILLIVLNPIYANVIDANKTFILVEDTNPDDNLKLKQAFAQLLVINTGENIVTILENRVFNEIDIKSKIKRSYFEKIDSKYLSDKFVNKYWFHIVMDKDFIQSVIKEANFSLLPHNREKIMLWAVKDTVLHIEDNQEAIIDKPLARLNKVNLPFILSYAYDDEKLIYWLTHWAQALGLILVLPTNDEIDMLAVTPESIKTLSFEAPEQGIARYEINKNLLVYVKRVDNNVKIRSGYAHINDDISIKYFQESSIEEGEVLYSVMEDVASSYSNSFKINLVDLETHTLQIIIEKIENYDEIGLIKGYLDSLSVIDFYKTVAASQGQLILDVDLSITIESFLQIIKREAILEQNLNNPINRLIFKLIKQ